MRIITNKSDLQRLRRLALQAQGLLQAKPFGRGISGAHKAIAHMGYVQLDTISVIQRAHHHVLQARVPGFKPGMAERLLIRCDIFEYWSHAAAFLPMADFRFSLPYKHAIKSGQTHWFKEPDHKLMQDLLARIRVDGPLRARDVETQRSGNSGWWDWKPAKKALEQLYMQGDLMVSDRTGFQKTYDLTERVLPAGTDTTLPSAAELAEHLLDQQLSCHGLVSHKGLTYLRRIPGLKNAMKDLLDERLAAGELASVQLHNGAVFHLPAGALDGPAPRTSHRLRILSPFDNVVIQRDRLYSLFGFDYQIECYVPAAKRRYGYFSLPLLYRDHFVGRMDAKAHRQTGELEIRQLHLEDHPFDTDAVIDALVKALDEFRVFQGCERVVVKSVEPDWVKDLINMGISE